MLISLCSLLLLCPLAVWSAAPAVTIDSDTKDSLLPGKNVVINCVSSEATTLTWSKVPGSQSRLPAATENSASKIVLDSLREDDGGYYTCTNSKGESAGVNLNVIGKNALYTVSNDIISNGTKEVILFCNQTFADPMPIIWTFPNGTDVVSTNIGNPPDRRAVIEDAGYVLKLKNDHRYLNGSDGRRTTVEGQYKCRFNTSSDKFPEAYRTQLSPLSQTLTLKATPDVHLEGATGVRSATKGEPLAIKCRIQGHQQDHVQWWRTDDNDGNKVVLVDALWDQLPECPGDITKKCPSGENATNLMISRDYAAENASRGDSHVTKVDQNIFTTTLHLKEVRDEDQAKYTCAAYNAVGRAQRTVQIRVKDKLAALWPFLGIVAEVIILCAIIFIYERRRSKTVDEEDEAEPMRGEVTETKETTVVRNRAK